MVVAYSGVYPKEETTNYSENDAKAKGGMIWRRKRRRRADARARSETPALKSTELVANKEGKRRNRI